MTEVSRNECISMAETRSHVLPFFEVELPFPVYDLCVAVATVGLFIPLVILVHRLVFGPLMRATGKYKGRVKAQ